MTQNQCFVGQRPSNSWDSFFPAERLAGKRAGKCEVRETSSTARFVSDTFSYGSSARRRNFDASGAGCIQRQGRSPPTSGTALHLSPTLRCRPGSLAHGTWRHEPARLGGSLWVQSSATGGLRSFTRTRPAGEVAPRAAFHSSLVP